MNLCRIAVLLLLASGCATTRIVNLDTRQGTPLVYKPTYTHSIEINETEFKSAVSQIVLDMKLNVISKKPGQDAQHSLLASTGSLVDGVQGRTTHPLHEQAYQHQSDSSKCLNLLAGELTMGLVERHTLALSFAFDTVWEGVTEALKDLANPAALRAMVVSIVGTALVMLVAPEPITKFAAIALTASLIAYLGTGPVWDIGRGFLRLIEESRKASDISELKDSGHRFGRVLGGNGARVLVIMALAAIGGKNAMAAQGPKLPGATQAAMRAQVEGGFQLSAALAGEVQSLALPSAEVLNITLAPTAVAAIAMGPGSGIQGDPEGSIHHICTDKNEVSEVSGGPWTPIFARYFKRARMELSDNANQVRIKGHQGPHPREYHEEVFRRIEQSMRACRNPQECRAALVDELAKIARDLTTEGTRLRKLITSSPEA